jgi:glycosyltransferase involved in cell wall biosynthesis
VRIVHVMGYYQPGLGYQENWLPFEQQKLGHEVAMVCADRYYPMANYAETLGRLVGDRFSPRAGVTSERGVEIHRLPVLRESVAHAQVLLRGLPGCVAALKPDVVHLHGVTAPTTHQVVFSPVRAPLVADAHTCRSNLAPFTWKKRLYYGVYAHGLGRLLTARIRRFLAICDDARDVLVDYCGIPPEAIVVNPLGADDARFRFDPEGRARLRAELGVGPSEVLLVYAGKFTAGKALPVLLDALRALGELPGVSLLLVGNGAPALEAELRAQARALTGGARVHFRDLVPNEALPALYSAADLGVWPGDPSNTIQEATMCGLPVVTPANRVTHHVLAGGNGFDFALGDAADLARVLGPLLSDPERLAHLRPRARAHAEAHLTWRAIAAEAVAHYAP